MRYIPHDNMFGIIEALSKAIEKGDALSGEELEYINMTEQVIGVAVNQIDFIRNSLIFQEKNR